MPFKLIPVVDLFAGPGGLGEGFASLTNEHGYPHFDIRVSIEKDEKAVETLKLRAFFRAFPRNSVPDCYYDYLRGKISKDDLVTNALVREEWRQAEKAVNRATLGETPSSVIDQWIGEAIGNHDPWVLIGGPPCQAYSTVGRSRMRKVDPLKFEKDERHSLYKEYLRIIRKFRPAVFVMENVKGLLSSTHGGSLIFAKILDDLSRPEPGLRYQIRSFVRADGDKLKPTDFIIEAENYGIPQKRHRVILFGIRCDLADRVHRPLVRQEDWVSVWDTLSGLPPIRSPLSRGKDSFGQWISALDETRGLLGNWKNPERNRIEERMARAVSEARFMMNTGAPFLETSGFPHGNLPAALAAYLHDPRLGGVCQHEARSHMREDLHRYLFAACYAEGYRTSPKLGDFPSELWPSHRNLDAVEVPFDDRFRSNYPRETDIIATIASHSKYVPCGTQERFYQDEIFRETVVHSLHKRRN